MIASVDTVGKMEIANGRWGADVSKCRVASRGWEGDGRIRAEEWNVRNGVGFAFGQILGGGRGGGGDKWWWSGATTGGGIRTTYYFEVRRLCGEVRKSGEETARLLRYSVATARYSTVRRSWMGTDAYYVTLYLRCSVGGIEE